MQLSLAIRENRSFDHMLGYLKSASYPIVRRLSRLAHSYYSSDHFFWVSIELIGN